MDDLTKEFSNIIQSYDITKINNFKEKIIAEAYTFHTSGNLIAAAKSYRFIIDNQFANADIYNNLGVILKQSGEIEESINVFKKSISLFPDSPFSYINLSNIFRDLKDLNEAEKYIKLAINVAPTNVDAFINHACILLDGSKINAAEEVIVKALEINSNHIAANRIYANLLIHNQRFEDAISFLQKVISIEPNLIDVYLSLSNIFESLHRFAESESTLKKAYEINPNVIEINFNLSVILKQRGNFKEAEIYAKKAIKLKPQLAVAHSNLSDIQRSLGDIDASLVSIREAITLAPDCALFHGNLGALLIERGDLEAARLSSLMSIKLDDQYFEAYKNLGHILFVQGKLTEAEHYLEQALKINSNFIDAYYDLALVSINLSKTEIAKKYWRKSLILQPDYEPSIFQLSQQLYLEKSYQLSISYLKNSSSIRCLSLHLACLLSLNKKQDFFDFYQEIIKLGICNPHIGAIIDHANILFDQKLYSTFCNKSINYIMLDSIDQELFSQDDANKFIDYLKSENSKNRNQRLLKEGSQTAGNLFSLNYSYIQSLKAAIENKIEKYKSKFLSTSEGFIKFWPTNYELRSWAVIMKKGGFLTQHNHIDGWISGSFYLKLPKIKGNNQSGNISFSYKGPQFPSNNENYNSTIIDIQERDICIFPSSLFHHTVPFECDEDRICFVFDLYPLS